MQISGQSYNLKFSGGVKEATRTAGQSLYRVFLRGNAPAASNKAVELSFRPLLPLILAGSGLLYNQGRENTSKHGGDSNAWLKMLMESGLAYAVLTTTRGVYPLFGLALAAYRSGQKPNALEQIKATVNTAVTLFMGYLGVNFFKGISEADTRFDNEMIYKTLKPKGKTETLNGDRLKVNHWIENLKKHDHDEVRGLGQVLSELGDKLQENVDQVVNLKNEAIPDKAPIHEALERIQNELTELKTKVSNQFGQIEKEAMQTAAQDSGKAVHNLMSNIRYAQSGFIKATRTMNPVFGYIITGLILGTPIAAGINHLIEKRYPSLKQKKITKSFLPAEHRILSGQAAHGGALAHASSGLGAGPAIMWPEINGGQPLQ